MASPTLMLAFEGGEPTQRGGGGFTDYGDGLSGGDGFGGGGAMESPARGDIHGLMSKGAHDMLMATSPRPQLPMSSGRSPPFPAFGGGGAGGAFGSHLGSPIAPCM
jgi:hypothetical protein